MLPPRFQLLTAGFWLLLAAWTWKLVEPNPFPELGAALGVWAYLAAKTLHLSAYAFLAAYGRWWPRTAPVRQVVLVLLVAHAVGTEVAQTFVPGRSGSVRDVLIDWAGITVGWTVARIVGRYRRT